LIYLYFNISIRLSKIRIRIIEYTHTYGYENIQIGGRGSCSKNHPVYINPAFFSRKYISLAVNKLRARVTRPRGWGFVRLSWCYVRLDNFVRNPIRLDDGERCNKCHMFHPIFFSSFFLLWTRTYISQIIQYRTNTYTVYEQMSIHSISDPDVCT